MSGKSRDSELSPRMLIALTSLLAGASVVEAAKAAGVATSSVHRWKRDPLFEARLAANVHRQRTTVEQRADLLLHKALDVVEAAIARGEERSAIALLKGRGVLNRPPEDPAAAAAEGRHNACFPIDINEANEIQRLLYFAYLRAGVGEIEPELRIALLGEDGPDAGPLVQPRQGESHS